MTKVIIEKFYLVAITGVKTANPKLSYADSTTCQKLSAFNYVSDKNKAAIFTRYIDVWNKLQATYSFIRSTSNDLDDVSFFIEMETSVVDKDDKPSESNPVDDFMRARLAANKAKRD